MLHDSRLGPQRVDHAKIYVSLLAHLPGLCCIQYGNAALHEAARNDLVHMVHLLLKHDADVNFRNNVRDTWGCGSCVGKTRHYGYMRARD